MGYLYVKVIESKKVAVRNSFFVNYPFIRIVLGKEKKTTNFKPGVEWWDKILNFNRISKGENLQMIVQARDKSIHVFGSDWLGEVKIDLDAESLLDGLVHQKWYKFGTGRKAHSRTARGYVHLAFQYCEDFQNGKRPFSTTPVEPVQTFEEWLAVNNGNWTSDSSAWYPGEVATEPGWKVPNSSASSMLRKSAPGGTSSIVSKDSVTRNRSNSNSTSIGSFDKSASYDQPKVTTRERSQTLPDVRSPSAVRKDLRFANVDSSDDEDYESDEEPREGNLIDFSFDGTTNDRMKGQHRPKKEAKISAQSDSSAASTSAASSSSSTTFAQPAHSVSPPISGTINDKIEAIRKLSLSTDVTPHPEASELFKVNDKPTFADWYVPADGSKPAHNPFLDMHDNFEPSTSINAN